MDLLDLKDLKKDPEVQEYYRKGNEILSYLGYTDHSIGHALIVSREAGHILTSFGYPEHTVQLARAAGCLHDIGNALNRSHHAEYGALLANDILRKYDIPLEDRVAIVGAVANHDETNGTAYDPVSAALIIADKTDVRRDRVMTKDPVKFDMHDRVNYAVVGQNLQCNPGREDIALNLQIDTGICTMYDYFEIFLDRMLMCRRAAEVLGVTFMLKANGQKVL